MKKSEKPTNAVLFNELVANAFDFLEQAIKEFDKKPKYSVVHFSTAIELILKARLVYEHWSLIVDGIPNIEKFRQGNFKSINYSELIPRIEASTGEKFLPEAKQCFDSIAQHRNKMVHFFHEADKKKNARVIAVIAGEQSAAWFYLQRLLDRWSPIFKEYEEQISALNRLMKNHKIFLSIVFEKIKPEIELDKKKGAIYRRCFNCEFEASEKKVLTENIFKYACKVCLLTENIISIKCPNCDADIEISEHDAPTFRCSECDQEIDQAELDDQLNTDPVTTDNYYDSFIINCALCMSPDTVIEHESFYLCKSCLGVEEEMNVCGWCSEGQIGGGDMEFSYLSGCEFCDGQAGQMKDD